MLETDTSRVSMYADRQTDRWEHFRQVLRLLEEEEGAGTHTHILHPGTVC